MSDVQESHNPHMATPVEESQGGDVPADGVNGCDVTVEGLEFLEGDTFQDSAAETSSLDEVIPQSSESNDDSNTPRTSRELKSILALSKEAKLDTNISTQRRKPLEQTKGTPKKNKMTSFPVTAESELENFDMKIDEKKLAKKRKSSSCAESSAEGATGEETKRGLQSISGDFIMARKPNKDVFCWRCHHDSVQVACETCPRAYHLRCLKQTIIDPEHWPCPECVSILKAENTQTRSKAMRGMSLEHLCSLLKFAVKRMIQCNGSEPFIHPVDERQFPEYRNYIVQPMTLTMLEKNIKENAYGSTQAFEADAKWILHNSIIFNSSFPDQSKLTTAAKTIVKICKQEMAEIENCPSCYLNANTKKHTWFVEVCPKPHLLVWAKLKGFPYWPAKVMSINSAGMADVRFFGAHDKAWVSVKDCYLYSIKDPNSGKQKRNDIIECVKELELYVNNLREIYGRVNFAPFKTLLEADSHLKQLQVFLPNYGQEGIEARRMKEIKGRALEEHSEEDKSEESSEEVEDEEEEDEEDGDDGKSEKSNGEKNKEGMTRIDYRESVQDTPKLVSKPVKAILIRKRYSADNIRVNSPKISKRELNKTDMFLSDNVNTHESLEKINNVQNDDEKKSPKLRISDQLIKKLEDMNENEGSAPSVGAERENGGEDITESKESSDSEDELLAETVRKEKIEEEVVEARKEGNEMAEIVEENKVEEKVIEENKEDCTVIKKQIESLQPSEEKSVIEEDEKAVKKQQSIKVDERSVAKEDILSSPLPKPDKKKTGEIDKEKETPKKRKLEMNKDKETDEEVTMFPPNKMVKLVPIENILQKKNFVETPPAKADQLIVLKEVRVVKDGKEIINKETEPENAPKDSLIKIKSEVESDEDNSDVQYMEAKRQYLSALNISEKQKIPVKPKQHEIRTRSKTEEKKCKDTPKGTEETTAVKATEPSKEIYIKSLTRMQAPKHKARKSFPTPNYNKKTIVARKLIPKTTNIDEELSIVNTATLQPTGNVMILPKLHYNKPVARDLSSPPVLTMLPRPQSEQNVNNKRMFEGGATQPPVIDVDNRSSSLDSELSSLKEILPDNVSKGVNDILCQPPPKLKPKPVGILNSVVEEGVPSTVGPVASRINSMAQKLGDYFRSLLVETISDLGKSNNPEATISSLKYEIEELNHKHSIELSEIRRNVSIVLKDIQKSVVEERERIVNETKTNCEMEMMKRVEEAKSKQWCANCSKEAQFYCCWNTSYCDYPCQQKHWPKHMSKCTQTSNNLNQSIATSCSSTAIRPAGQQLVLTQTTAPKFGALFAKPQKVYLKRTNTPFKPTTGSHITLVESTPGNFELLGSGPIAVNGKILASTSVIEKIKSGNIVTVTAPSGAANTQLTSANQKVNTVSKSTASCSDSEH